MSKLFEISAYEAIGFRPLNTSVPFEDIKNMPAAKRKRVRAYMDKHRSHLPCIIPEEVIDGTEGWEKL